MHDLDAHTRDTLRAPPPSFDDDVHDRVTTPPPPSAEATACGDCLASWLVSALRPARVPDLSGVPGAPGGL